MDDQAVASAINDFCELPKPAGSSGTAQVSSLAKRHDQGELLERDTAENPLPNEEPKPAKELKPLPAHLKYAYLGEDETKPIIINNQLTQGQEDRLLEVLRRNQRAIGWKLTDLLVGKQYFSFVDGYSGYFQIAVNPEDQEKTTFTCPFGTYAYRRMPFGLCNAPGTLQRCMMSIFSDLLEDCIEIFMDDFTVYGDDFDQGLHSLNRVLERCRQKDLVLNFEKCHFMVTEGIVLGHIVSSRGIEVDFHILPTRRRSEPFWGTLGSIDDS
ncbi:uncharacterized protein LOC121745935 [Salvia splendens]|uniref:uncharacterized protein LOC121745935 n=1 Tax=Salvia splendens TaxID=180675 RepID=UPI001C2517B8|nr:uncharacterized protein LOC121745935 [Salvia splendens]